MPIQILLDKICFPYLLYALFINLFIYVLVYVCYDLKTKYKYRYSYFARAIFGLIGILVLLDVNLKIGIAVLSFIFLFSIQERWRNHGR